MLLFPTVFFSQKETAQWRFGLYSGFNFMSGSPVWVNTAAITAGWGSATVSDSAGNLLFYLKEAGMIYNKNNDTMANGLLQAGSIGGSQSSLIIRKSGSKYYVIMHNNGSYFHSPPIPSMTFYNIVDMGLASGLGSVTTSDPPISPTGTAMVGKLAATKHCNGKDHWLLTHTGFYPGNNHYYTYLVNSDSISTTPVISAIGSVQPRNYSNLGGFSRGFHKFSPNGRKVCASMLYRTVELYDFDKSTGVLSNVIKLDSIVNPDPNYSLYSPDARGIEFSPDGTKVYVTYANNHPFLCQFDLCAGSPSAIAASKTVISWDTVTSTTGTFPLQLAYDGKIYVIKTSSISLGAINNPNAPGALCNFSPQAVFAGTNNVWYPYNSFWLQDLPNFASDFFYQQPAIPPVTASITCGNASFSLPPGLCPGAGYSVTGHQWDFGDSLSGSLNVSSGSNPNHTFSANGTYRVKLVLQYPTCADTLKTTVNITGLPTLSITGKSSICAGESATLGFSGADSYSLDANALMQGNTTVQPSVTTIYTITGIDVLTGCRSIQTFSLKVSKCNGLLSPGEPGSGIRVYPNPNTGIVTLEADNENEIKITDISGRLLYHETKTEGVYKINLSSYANGFYFLEARNAQFLKTIKLVKE
jgi:hypothetical protein